MASPLQQCESHFRTAVDAIFSNWAGLQLVLNNNPIAGQPRHAVASWLVDATVQWFRENKDLEQSEVEEYLEDIFDREFNCLVQDGSAEGTARLLCEFFALCCSGRNSADVVLERLRTLPKCDLSQCQVQLGDQEEAVEGEDAGPPPPPQQEQQSDDMEVDDSERGPDPDGWVTVQSNKQRNKKR